MMVDGVSVDTDSAPAHDVARGRDLELARMAQMASALMHDVNNALNPIVAAAFLLRQHAETPHMVRDYASRIERATGQMSDVGKRIGRFVRQSPLHPDDGEPIDLSVLAAAAFETLGLQDGVVVTPCAPVRVVRELGEHVVARGVWVDLHEALVAVIRNAVEAMTHAGTIVVRTSIEGGYACVLVQDDGVGMTDDVNAQALNPYFTTKGAVASGLGLSEAYGVIRRHGGQLTIVSSPQSGTTVAIKMPAHVAARITQTSDDATSHDAGVDQQTPRSVQRVLVVEDHDDVRQLVKRVLESDAHVVHTVSTCAEALTALEANSPTFFTIALLDVTLPDGNGWELAAFMRLNYPGVRIGVMTGWDPEANADALGGIEFALRKPFRIDDLLSHIAGVRLPATTT